LSTPSKASSQQSRSLGAIHTVPHKLDVEPNPGPLRRDSKQRTMDHMPNLASTFKSEISRLARKEVRSEIISLKKAVASQRTEIASLKKQMRDLIATSKKSAKTRQARPAEAKEGEGTRLRFSAKGLKSHRQKLGLSAKDYGLLVSASALSIYKWEEGKVRPREGALAKIAEVRSLGKRELLRRLDELSGGSA